MIYSVETTARIMGAMQAAQDANNGYAFLFLAPEVPEALRLAGLHVFPGAHPINGRPCHMVFTADSYRAYVASQQPGALQ